MKVLVAKADGRPDRHGEAFAPGSIQPCRVPVTRNFDQSLLLGMADVIVEGEDVYAEIDVAAADMIGRFPALGGRSLFSVHPAMILRFEVMTVALCDSENIDQRIPAIKPNA